MPKQTESKDTPSSISAAYISYALFRASTRAKYRHLFSDKERMLLEHMAKYAVAAFPNTKMGQKLKKVVMETHKEQRRFFSRNIVPCYDDSFMLRKIMVRHQMEEAINNGATQVVILGGGYDIRGLISSATFSDVTFYELDRGPTLAVKIEAIHALSSESFPLNVQKIDSQITQINSNFYALNCDLNERTIECLIPLGFKTEEQTFIVAEGLSAYLDEESNVHLLQTIRHLFQHPQSQLLIGYIERLNCLEGLAKEAHKEHKEPHLFALPRMNAIPYVRECGLSITARKTHTDLLSNINKKEDAEYYKNVSKAVEHYYVISNTNLNNQYDSIDLVPELTIPIAFDRKNCEDAHVHYQNVLQ